MPKNGIELPPGTTFEPAKTLLDTGLRVSSYNAFGKMVGNFPF